jgi:hypothetical protein
MTPEDRKPREQDPETGSPEATPELNPARASPARHDRRPTHRPTGFIRGK